MKERSNRKKTKIENLDEAILKKALGYDSTEVTEEYAVSDGGEIVLSKKKVIKKNVPPDITAIKILLDKKDENLESMSDEELLYERDRLLGELYSAEQKEKTKKE